MKAAEGSIEIINIPGFGDFPVSNIKLTDDEAIVFNYNAADGTFATDQLFLVNASAEKLADQHYDFRKAAFTPAARHQRLAHRARGTADLHGRHHHEVQRGGRHACRPRGGQLLGHHR